MGWATGFEPVLTVPQTVVLTANTTLTMVSVAGFAPARHFWQEILSLSGLLIPPYRDGVGSWT